MNLETTLFLLATLGLGIWGSQHLMKKSGENKMDAEVRKFLKILAWGIRGVIFFLVIIMLNRFGIITVPNPFDGPKVENTLPLTSSQSNDAVAPEIDAINGRPDMDTVRDAHQKQLNDFEKKD